jgi:ABC-type bacteriocin/lantibiotic exporter with double-glycine peptidase domain
MSKIKVVKQNDLKDCGVASLLSIIRYYGGNVPSERLRIDTHTSKNGTTAYNLIIASKKYGFDAAGYKVNKDNLFNEKIICPFIAHVLINNLNHFLVVYKINSQKILIMDPAKGKREINIKEFCEMWTGNIIVLHPRNKITYLKSQNTLKKLVKKFAFQEKELIIKVFITNILFTIFLLISSYYFKIGLDMIQNLQDFNNFKMITIPFGIIVIAKCIFRYLRSYYENYLNKNIDIHLLKDFLSQIFHLPFRVIQSRSSGEIMTRINELNNIKNYFSELFVSIFFDFTMTLITIPILYHVSKRLFFILCFSLLIYLLLGYLFSKSIYQRAMQNIDYEDSFNTTILENIKCLNSIKNLNQNDKILEKIENRVSQYVYDTFSFTKMINIQENIKFLIDEYSLFLIDTFGLISVFNGKLLVSDLILFNSLMMFFLEPVKNIINSLPKFNFLKASICKINDFMDIECEHNRNSRKIDNYQLKICNVSYSYNDYENILNDYSLVIKENEHLMLKGNSGSGKSTICKLINAEFQPQRGLMMIGDYCYNEFTTMELHNVITYVSQNENLYNDTIRNNILFYRDVSEEKFMKICKICRIDDIVKGKPMGYETFLETDVNNLSGGEKQRIILARACVSNFKILIIDEALSETDFELEKNIITEIKHYFINKTIIYVSHKNQDKLFNRVITIGEINE